MRKQKEKFHNTDPVSVMSTSVLANAFKKPDPELG